MLEMEMETTKTADDDGGGDSVGCGRGREGRDRADEEQCNALGSESRGEDEAEIIIRMRSVFVALRGDFKPRAGPHHPHYSDRIVYV